MKKVLLGLIYIAFIFTGCLKQTPKPIIVTQQTPVNTQKPSSEVQKLIETYNLQIVDADYIETRNSLDIQFDDRAILVDARPYKDYRRKTIPFSKNLPIVNFKKHFNKFKNISRDKEIIVFCNGFTSIKSAKVAILLTREGFNNVKLYPGGMLEWKKTYYTQVGYSVIRKAVRNNSAFLIDIRPYKEYVISTILGSVSIPYEKLSSFQNKFPADKNIHIIVFSNNGKSLKSHYIARKLLSLGYKNVSVYLGGFSQWEKSNTKKTKRQKKEIKNKKNNKDIVNKKEIEQKIDIIKISPYLGPIKKGKDIGTVDGAWFVENYQNFSKNIIIVDVRREDERKLGFIKGSIHVSFEENDTQDFMSKLPKKGYIIFTSLTGARSAEAYELMKNEKYERLNNIVYLDANIKCKENNCIVNPNKPIKPTIW